MLRAQQETVIRWDQEEQVAHLWTAFEPVANRWKRAGIAVRLEHGSWWAEVPLSDWHVRVIRRREGRPRPGQIPPHRALALDRVTETDDE